MSMSAASYHLKLRLEEDECPDEALIIGALVDGLARRGRRVLDVGVAIIPDLAHELEQDARSTFQQDHEAEERLEKGPEA